MSDAATGWRVVRWLTLYPLLALVLVVAWDPFQARAPMVPYDPASRGSVSQCDADMVAAQAGIDGGYGTSLSVVDVPLTSCMVAP